MKKRIIVKVDYEKFEFEDMEKATIFADLAAESFIDEDGNSVIEISVEYIKEDK